MPRFSRTALLVFLISFIGIFLFSPNIVHKKISHAQNPQATAKERLVQAQQDYSFQISKYEECRKKYITDRATYIAFQTATSKNTAFQTTKECLSKIYDVYISYLRFIKEQGNAFTWNQNDDEKTAIFKTLDDEITYFQLNQPKVGNLQTLEDTVTYSSELKTHITKTTQVVVQIALASYEVAESEAALEDFVNMSDTIKKYVLSEINQDEYSSFIANWDSEVADIRLKSEGYNKQARDTLSSFKPQAYDLGGINSISGITQKTKNELTRSKAIFAEILKLI